jgi:uncharacterized protein
MQYHVSDYNFFVPRDGGWIVYNAACGSFSHVDSAVGESLRQKQVPDLDQTFLTVLDEAGIIHSGDQKARILKRFELQKFARSHVSFTLAPTIECNYACWYCYQNERRYIGSMSDDVQKNTLRFIDIVVQSCETFDITWYGGEPLLAMNVISNISEALIRRYGAGKPKMLASFIVTNGMLLNDDTVATLKRCGVTNAQISIDNFYHLPPARRGLFLPDGTLSPIFANILKFRDQLRINIRINTSALEDGELDRMMEALTKHGVREMAYFARVEDNVKECNSLGSAIVDEMMTRKDYAKTKIALTETQNLQQYVNEAQQALRPKNHFCGATDGSMFVIDFRGDISRCWISAGVSEEKSGNVAELFSVDRLDDTNFLVNSEVDRKWREYTPFNFNDCRDCRVLPLCMGGCSHSRVLHDAVRPPCEAIKFNINKYVADIGAHLPINT